ncbi:MAG: MerR family transcriptional regulator, partial [Christensenellaceae bacterium]
KMFYSIGQAAQILNVSPYTIRYYDKEGLLGSLQRESGSRQFTEEDLDHLRFLCCLRSTGMSLADIKTFLQLCEQGDDTLLERYELLNKQHRIAEEELLRAQHQLEVLERKQCWLKNCIRCRLGKDV